MQALEKKREAGYTFNIMRKYLPLILILCVCGVCAGIFFFISKKESEKNYIAFYALSADTVQALQTVLKDRFPNIEQQFEWKIADPSVSITEFMEKNPQTVFIFSQDNRSLFEARQFFIRHDEERFQYLPSTFENNIFSQKPEDTYYGFPLLINPIKLACNSKLAAKIGINSYIIEDDFDRICTAAKSSMAFPFVCAAGDDEQLFAMISAVIAIHGARITPEDFSSLGKDADLHACCPPALKAAFDTLVEWKRQGFLHPEWFRLLDSDIAVFMEFNHTALAAMPLSASRKQKQDILQNFLTLQIPLPLLLDKRNMPASVIVWAQSIQPSKRQELSDSMNAIREFLYEQQTDELLAHETGLAPVFSAAQVQDSEASSGRYWAASSNMVLPFFGDIVCTSGTEKAQLADSIRRYLTVDGVSY